MPIPNAQAMSNVQRISCQCESARLCCGLLMWLARPCAAQLQLGLRFEFVFQLRVRMRVLRCDTSHSHFGLSLHVIALCLPFDVMFLGSVRLVCRPPVGLPLTLAVILLPMIVQHAIGNCSCGCMLLSLLLSFALICRHHLHGNVHKITRALGFVYCHFSARSRRPNSQQPTPTTRRVYFSHIAANYCGSFANPTDVRNLAN